MRHGAIEEGILESPPLMEYLAKNLDSWVHFITRVLGVAIPKAPGLMFISGLHKTLDWAVAAYATAGKFAEFHVNADVFAASGAFSVSSASKKDVAPIQNWGPRLRAPPPGDHSSCLSTSSSVPHPEEQYDQCVFLNYYSLKKRLRIPKFIRAGAGYDELPKPDSDDEVDNSIVSVTPDGDTEESVSIVANATATHVCPFAIQYCAWNNPFLIQDWDPVGCLLDYILNVSSH